MAMFLHAKHGGGFDCIDTFADPFMTVAVKGDDKIAKVSLVGVGMRSHAGVASKMFRTLAAENINMQMISTSEIKISVVVEDKYMELAVRALHQAFELDKAVT